MKRVFFNNDFNSFFCGPLCYDFELKEQEIRNYIRQYKGSNITDFSINTFAQTSMFPSKVCETEMDLRRRMIKESSSAQNNGVQSSSQSRDWRDFLVKLWENGLDFIQIWIDELRSIGIKPWCSVRMNDLHHNFQGEFFHTDFRRSLKGKCDIVRHRKPIEQSEMNFDYSFEVIRDHFLDAVKDTLDRYDVDGIDLDWMREADVFAYGDEFFGKEILTGFMKKVKNIVVQAEKRYGHKIEICIRCLTTPQYNIEKGLDILRWAKEGLIDLVAPSPKYATIDNGAPYYLWKQILEPYGVQVLAGYELLLKTDNIRWDDWSASFFNDQVNTVETVFGSAAAFLAQGVDGLYFYNYFNYMFNCSKYGVSTYFAAKNKKETSLHTAEGYYRLWYELSLNDGVYSLPRRVIYTYTDKAPLWRCRTPFQTTMSIDNGLPRELTGYDKNNVITPAFFRMETGKILPDSKVILYLGVNKPLNETEGFNLFVNGRRVEYLGETECLLPKLTKSKLYAFEIENDGDLPDAQIIEMFVDNVNGGGVLDYIEISINKDFVK